MMNAQDLQEIFEAAKIATDDKIDARTINNEGLEHLSLVYKGSSGLPVILIESREGFVDFDEVKGIGISNKSYSLEGIKITRFYEYRCRHQMYQIIFFPFISDLLSRLSEGMNIVSAHKTSIKLWKHCFEDPESSILPVDKEIGLIGELFMLNNFLEINEIAVEWWQGPLGGVDFQAVKNMIEVKTTLKKNHVHTINGLEQLEEKEDYGLFLSSIILQSTEDDDSNTLSLAEMYSAILDRLSDDPVQTDIFNSKIKRMKITPEIIELHDFRQYRLMEVKIFPVSDKFPRLAPASLKIPLSSRISKVRYDIDLDGLESLNVEEFNEEHINHC